MTAFPIVRTLATAGAAAVAGAWLRSSGEMDETSISLDVHRAIVIMRGLLPLSRRLDHRDDAAGEPRDRPLAGIHAATLLISAADDLDGTPDAARFAAGRMTGAELDEWPGGGLLIGRGTEMRATISAYLEQQAPVR